MRNESQIVTMAPAEATFGEDATPIKPLTVSKQGAWRDKMIQIMEPIMEKFRAENTASSFAQAYGTAVRLAPETFAELVAEYAGIDPQQLKDKATPEQIALAFNAIMEMAYPFAKALETVTRLIAEQ